MSWFQYVIKNWKRLHLRWVYIGSVNPNASWSNIITNSPHLEGVKLWIPQSIYLYAGYINLRTHEIHASKDVSEVGSARLQDAFNYLTKECGTINLNSK